MNVPDGWRVATLDELGVQARPGFASGKHSRTEGGVQHLRPMNISRLGRLDLADAKYVEDTTDRRVAQDDVIFNNTNSPALIGKTALITAEGAGLAYSNHMTRLRMPGEGVLLPAYLGLFLHHLWEKRYFESICSNHVNQASVGSRKLLETAVCFPEVSEQRRIVEVAEEHMAHLDAADASLASADRRMGQWRAGSLERVIWGTAAEDVSVGEILREPMRNGRSDRASSSGEGTRTLTLTAVTKRSFTDHYTKITSTPADVASNLWLEPGDILVQRSNTPDLVGTCARYQGPREWAIFPDLLIRIRPDESRMRSDFLELALRTERAHRTLRSKAKGLAGSMPKIDQAALAGTRVPCPPPEIQRSLVSEAHYVQAQADAALAATGRTRLRSAALRRAVLAAAFSGQLTSSTDLSSPVSRADVR